MKLSQIDKVIAQLEGERHVLDLAIAKLRAQADKKPARVRTPKPVAVERSAS